MKWFMNRLREPSTGLGLSMLALFARTNPKLASYGLGDLFDALAVLGGGQAVVAGEAKKPQQ